MSQGHRLDSPVFFCIPSIKSSSIVKNKAAEVGRKHLEAALHKSPRRKKDVGV
ncbi:hypothetical protein HMPREF9087_0647 [Enterococcus casseliflavus ATCC 12755]|uniref:Uncharacterized protein n=1 Tax=Enterococcus casseliflavus ATCC 12755 TaxID=888066 RepID=F0EGV5_ENTCA|nr:hypothetical protein HMPREF9087_0647 [Enterococcus casseliflavus ATCC 12755]EPH90585.1 hypothetical protein D922_02930 [Enterococcus faecalis 06-MB-DW-09]